MKTTKPVRNSKEIDTFTIVGESKDTQQQLPVKSKKKYHPICKICGEEVHTNFPHKLNHTECTKLKHAKESLQYYIDKRKHT